MRTNEQIFEAQWRLAVWKKSQCISHRNSAGMRWLLQTYKFMYFGAPSMRYSWLHYLWQTPPLSAQVR